MASDRLNSDIVAHLAVPERVENLPEDSFEIQSVIGFNPEVAVKYYSGKDGEELILYVLGHIACIFEVQTQNVRDIINHERFIEFMELDMSGRYLLSGDCECIVVWDMKSPEVEKPIALRTIPQPFGEAIKVGKAVMSSMGRYIAITSKTTQNTEVQFWLWSFGHKDCDGKEFIKSKFGEARHICFSSNQNEEEFFAITLTHTVAFGYWDTKKSKLEIYIPEIKKFKQINASVYIPKTRNVASITEHGQMLIWSDVFIESSPRPVSNRKNFIKAIPLPKCPANDIKIIDDYVVTVDDSGEIRFYDADIKLMFTCSFWKLPPIRYIKPSLAPRKYMLVDPTEFGGSEENYDTGTQGDVEIIYRTTCPTDLTIQANPFIVRNFYITTKMGDVILCDIINKKTDHFLYRCEDAIVAADLHPYKPWILGCNRLGRIMYYDYNTYERIAQVVLTPSASKEDLEPAIVSAVQISPNAEYISVGYTSGLLYILDPTTLLSVIENPFNFTCAEILRIVFCTEMKFCAYTDANHTVVLLSYEPKWAFIGKYRYHCKPIVNIIFTTFEDHRSLITIGQDRLFIEYDLKESEAARHLVIKRDIRLEQSAVITAAELVPSSILQRDTSKYGQVVLTADNHYKFKVFDAFTAENLFTFLGPIFESPLTNIIYVPSSDSIEEPFLLVHSEKTLGLVVAPIDGNPFRYSGVIAHPSKIHRLNRVVDGDKILVVGCDDSGGTIWKIQREHALKHLATGGEGLLPFCSCLPGGKRGWLFNEIQDLFYYIQIMVKGINDPEERQVTDYIPVSEVVDFMRGIGFFPSDFEAKNMINEITRTKDPMEITPTEITFDDLLKLFVNHKPVVGYKLDDIEKAVTHFSSDEYELDIQEGELELIQQPTFIASETILDLLTKKGERVTEEQGLTYLQELFSDSHRKSTKFPSHFSITQTDVDEDHEFPEAISIEEFCRDLLGLHVSLGSDGRLYSTHNDVIKPSNVDKQLRNTIQVPTITVESEEVMNVTDLHEIDQITDDYSD